MFTVLYRRTQDPDGFPSALSLPLPSPHSFRQPHSFDGFCPYPSWSQLSASNQPTCPSASLDSTVLPMFTPPASPCPAPGAVFSKSQEAHHSEPTSSSTHLSPPSSSTPSPSPTPSKAEFHQRPREVAKRRIGRRFRNAVILVPLVLIAITATARLITHGPPPFLSSLTSPHSWTSSFLPSTPCHEPHHHHDGATSNLGKRSPQLPGVGDTTSTSATRSSTPAVSPTVASVPTVPQSSPALPTPFPQAVNGIITKNFSSVSCMNFITEMAGAREFRSCRPFSLLLGSSDDFIAVS